MIDCKHCGWPISYTLDDAEYVRKEAERNPLQHELLDLIKLMPDSQTDEIMDFIRTLREARARGKH